MEESDRLITPNRLGEQEVVGEVTLRPNKFDDYPGQEKAKANMKVFVEAALQRKEPLDHVLLHGPPGLGKTTLANIISHS